MRRQARLARIAILPARAGRRLSDIGTVHGPLWCNYHSSSLSIEINRIRPKMQQMLPLSPCCYLSSCC
jgi:hypothetical protein